MKIFRKRSGVNSDPVSSNTTVVDIDEDVEIRTLDITININVETGIIEEGLDEAYRTRYIHRMQNYADVHYLSLVLMLEIMS